MQCKIFLKSPLNKYYVQIFLNIPIKVNKTLCPIFLRSLLNKHRAKYSLISPLKLNKN